MERAGEFLVLLFSWHEPLKAATYLSLSKTIFGTVLVLFFVFATKTLFCCYKQAGTLMIGMVDRRTEDNHAEL